MKHTLNWKDATIAGLNAYAETTGTPASQVAERATSAELARLENLLPPDARARFQARRAELAAQARPTRARGKGKPAGPGVASTSPSTTSTAEPREATA